MSTRTQRIQHLLTDTFHPDVLHVLNGSCQRHTNTSDETHFKIIMVSKKFENLSLVQRHQAVYRVLKTELDTGLHALVLHLHTPTEWPTYKEKVLSTPSCCGDANGHD